MSKVVSEYVIIRQVNSEVVEHEVNRMIRDRWEPVGGICIGGSYIYQAMVRHIHHKPTLKVEKP